MNKRVLGKDLTVSPVGLGCMGMTHAYGVPADEREMEQLLIQAVDMGYTFFDTAECYTGVRADGTTVFNEELVGRALRALSGPGGFGHQVRRPPLGGPARGGLQPPSHPHSGGGQPASAADRSH